MISIIVLILICIAIEVLDKTLGDELNPFFLLFNSYYSSGFGNSLYEI